MTNKKQSAKNKSQSTHGFAHLGLIIAIVAVIAAIGFGGWYVWQNNKQDEPKRSSSNSQTQNQEETKSEPEPEQQDPSEGGKYLVIKEWGARFLLPEELKGDIQYGLVISTSSDDQSAHFAIGEIDKLPESNCKLVPTTVPGTAGQAGGVADVHRTATRYSSELSQRYLAELHIGTYWYYVATMRDACFSAPDQEFARLVSEVELLGESLTGIQLIPTN